MHRQVGDLRLDEKGVAQRELLVRHLVLPYNIAGSEAVIAFRAGEISKDSYLNLMDQYRSCYRADENQPLDRPLSDDEYRQALGLVKKYGLSRLDSRHGWRFFG